MPELPEVETIKNLLSKGGPDWPPLVGKTIAAAQVLWQRTLATPAPKRFSRQVVGQAIKTIERRGKFLSLVLSRDTLLIHLRMSGDLQMEPQILPFALHHRLVLNLDDGWRLALNDPRKFGRVWLTDQPNTVLGKLGPEPLDDAFTPEALYQRLQARHRQLKPLLMDQSFLAGLGNIYTDEALHLACLHPLTLSNQLTLEQAERLWASLRAVLQEGIRRNGASIDWVYRGGEFQNYFRVYQRTGEACPTCGTPIQRTTVGQRGTHFCPTCQPAPT
ncbi:MAG: bifunctional DNA-formamidopyrimidine glycosylase/DNA-(apurinic or apyrimidinic site) lyase [Anaerolineales bacterium]|nr:bifunctional DNA-formamidopyrimidine glycosylase/DNA-(apurinic or apyrimidinic site) lyase [Anaerolineales bacterium]